VKDAQKNLENLKNKCSEYKTKKQMITMNNIEE